MVVDGPLLPTCQAVQPSITTARPTKAPVTATCVICLSAPPVYACVPCGHRVFCDTGCHEMFMRAAQAERVCPTCRATIDSTIRVYDP